jgi:hypothetical protein
LRPPKEVFDACLRLRQLQSINTERATGAGILVAGGGGFGELKRAQVKRDIDLLLDYVDPPNRFGDSGGLGFGGTAA